MITWYLTKDRMPEVGDDICIYFVGAFGTDKIIREKVKRVRGAGLKEDKIYSLNEEFAFTHWAYAKDFNLPKSEG